MDCYQFSMEFENQYYQREQKNPTNKEILEKIKILFFIGGHSSCNAYSTLFYRAKSSRFKTVEKSMIFFVFYHQK